MHRAVNWNLHVAAIECSPPASGTPPHAVFSPSTIANSSGQRSDESIVCLGVFERGVSPTLRTRISEYDNRKLTEIASQDHGSLFRTVAMVDDCISPVRFGPIDGALERCLSPQLLLSRANGLSPSLHLWDRWQIETGWGKALQGITIAFAIEIVCDGEVVATGRTWYTIEQLRAWAHEYAGSDHSFKDLKWAPSRMPDTATAAQHEWSVRLTASPATALQNLESDEYWDGEITLPLRVHAADGAAEEF